MEAHRITLQLAEVLAGDQLHLHQALELEPPEQYSTCQVVGLGLRLIMLKMVAVGMDRILAAHQVELAAAAAAAAAAEDQAN